MRRADKTVKTRVYSFKPKGKGYNVFVTKIIHGNSTGKPNSSGHSGGFGDALITMAARGIARSVFRRKR